MLLTLLYCLTFAWDPASGPVHHYDLSIDGVVKDQGILETQASVCMNDLDPHTVSVQAFDIDGNASPMSNESDVVQMEITPPFYVATFPPVVQADMDGDGVVGMGDFGLWSPHYGKCHDGQVEIPCP